jgi:ribonuclease HI
MVGFPKDFKIFTHGGDRTRSAVIVNNNELDVILISQASHEDAIVAEFRHKGLIFFGASLYLPIDRDIERDLEIIEEITRLTKGEGLLLALDSNARSKIWSDTHTNARGRAMEEFIITRNLTIMNEVTEVPTFESSRGRSWIDLTLCNSKLAKKIRNWTCGDELSCSDHNIILFEIDTGEHSNSAKLYTAKRYNTKAEKWGAFTLALATSLKEEYECSGEASDLNAGDIEISHKITQLSDTDLVIHKFTSAITTACDTTFQVSKPGNQAAKKRSVPWWTKELSLLRKKTTAMRRRYQRTKNNNNLRLERRQLYEECNRIYQTKLREEKLQSWKNFCSNTNNMTSNPWNGVYRYAAGRLKNRLALTTLKIDNNNYTTDMKTTINQMIEYFVPEDSEEGENAHHKQVRLQAAAPLKTSNDVIFTRHEIQAILEGFDPKKAPGEDALSSEILLQVFRNYPTAFTQIYNECLRRGHFPTQWKRSVILPIAKPGKEGLDTAGKFRPISLINIAGKTLEKLLIDRINYHLYSKGLLNENQYGFRPQKSTVDAAMAVKQFAEFHLLRKNVVILTSLDVQGAFDSAWWPALLNNLRNVQCPRNLYNLTRNYFSDRVAILCANTYKKERTVTKGCPQGSCCSPGLWNVLFNTLLNLEFTTHTTAIAFADDLAILTYGETNAEAEAYTNSELAKIENWAKQNKMIFNEHKSKTMLISRKRKSNRESINIYLNNRRLEQVKETKYLGIYFDDRLKFNTHIENTIDKSRKMIYMLGKTAKLNWGLGHKSLKTIYEGAIVPIMTYGAPVWEEAIKTQRLLRKMQSTQRLINIKIAKAYRTISYDASCVLAGVQPIGIEIEGKTILYKKKHSTGKGDKEWDTPLSVTDWPHPAQRAEIQETTGAITYHTEIFTDGSKTENKVGAGVVIYKGRRIVGKSKYRLKNHCSNNQAEQIAILKALELLQSSTEQTNRTVAIYTDSKVTLDSLKNNTKHSAIIEEIRNMVLKLKRQSWTIHFGWVKAHVGIEGNEAADTLAKEAAEDEDDRNYVYVRKPLSTIVASIKEVGLKKWQEHWERSEKGATCKSFFPNIQQRLKLRIPITPEFSALVSGHGKTKAYLNRFKLTDNPMCPCNEGEQTVEHIIYECSILESHRSFMIKNISMRGGLWPPTNNELVNKYLDIFTMFVKSIDFSILQ